MFSFSPSSSPAPSLTLTSFNIENLNDIYKPIIKDNDQDFDSLKYDIIHITNYYLNDKLKYKPKIDEIIEITNIELKSNYKYFDKIKQLMFIIPEDISNIIDKTYLNDDLNKFITKYDILYNK